MGTSTRAALSDILERMNQTRPTSSPVFAALAKSQDYLAQTAETAVEKSYRQKCARRLRALAKSSE